MDPTSMHESDLSKTIGTLGSGKPIPRGPMDKFITSQPRQSTLNSKWKQEERKEVCRKIGRFMYSKGLSFNTVNDPYWFPMMGAIANFEPGFKPPSMHELRTWILKEESRCLINFLVNSLAGTWFMKSIDASDTIKNGELMFKYLDEVVEEIGEDNVVQVITDNASNYVNVGMRLMEKRRRLWWTPCAAHCIDLMLENIGKLNVHATTLSRARYNTRLRERSLQRKQNVDLILVEEIDSDDEWIAEKEDPFFPLDLCWLQDNELFSVDAIRVVSSNSQETQASSDHMVSLHFYKRKHNEVPSTSGGKGKEKELNLTPIVEDEDLHEMGIHDSGHFPTIDTLDEDDDDLGEEDLS
ncbi:hypothetical protein CK203_028059 [Vitis vinifera]|uniref:DUF659 domain-containing protein n=1 Tax=Vitis vinifera TaxID=29760 RepID=A0A438ILT4_VITVI|nr:hypothetical protein CK203_028059 [Vitis vinifera]